MYPEDACIQMELLGHNFFVFCNAETDQVNVVYKRKGDTYGPIERSIKPDRKLNKDKFTACRSFRQVMVVAREMICPEIFELSEYRKNQKHNL